MKELTLNQNMLDANISYTRFSLLIHIRDISMHFAISRVNIMYICITFVILRSKELKTKQR